MMNEKENHEITQKLTNGGAGFFFFFKQMPLHEFLQTKWY